MGGPVSYVGDDDAEIVASPCSRPRPPEELALLERLAAACGEDRQHSGCAFVVYSDGRSSSLQSKEPFAVVTSPRSSDLPIPTLRLLHEAGARHLEQFASNTGPLGDVLAKESDLAAWHGALELRPEVEQYRTAHRDLGLSLYSIATGLYRQAFSSLRSFLEVFFGNLHFSAAELRRRQWVAGRRDLSWAEITDRDNGLFSSAYIREFHEDAVDEGDAVRQRAMGAYRRCSEYLHGNVPTTSLLPAAVEYAPEVVQEWITIANDALVAIHHCLFVRYYAELDTAQRHAVEAVLEQHLSTYRSVRLALGLPVEDSH